MKRTLLLLVCALAFGIPSGASAQNWRKVAQLTSNGASAYFFNANEGLVGTGNYQTGSAIQIFHTNDGGQTWSPSILPSMNLFGQITDLFFTDRLNGWATLKETNEHGWSGLYRSVDGGLTWKLQYQMDFPVAVRETSVGVFVSDRLFGIRLSTDGGRSFRLAAGCNGALGLDFLSARNGYMSAEAIGSAPHLRTADNGQTWQPSNQLYEAWGVFADRIAGAFYFASEKDNGGASTQSTILRSADLGLTFRQVWSGFSEQLSGGISGWQGCKSIVYAQGGPNTFANGLLRSTNDGQTWIWVGGPNNYDDKRFAVTGRGAVVYACDRGGGIWKTVNGGDGTLSPSVMSLVTIQPLQGSIVSASLCDSAVAPFLFALSSCDSARVVRVVALDDLLSETSTDLSNKYSFDQIRRDTLRIIYRPQDQKSKTIHYRITISQSDGYIEDTIISQTFQGLSSNPRLMITTNGLPDSIDFGRENICTGDSLSEITLSNVGCASVTINSITFNGAEFTLRSKFAPVTLDAGNQRSYLVRFKPTTLGLRTGTLYVSSTLASDSIHLTGFGITGRTGIAFSQSQIVSNLCDSVDRTVQVHNTSCSALTIDSITIPTPFQLLKFSSTTLPSDSTINLDVRFVPISGGPSQVSVVVHSHIGTEVFDTTLLLTATGIDQGTLFSLSSNTINLDTVSICGSATGEVVLTNKGCNALSVDSIVIGTGQLSLLTPNHAVLARGENDTIRVRFNPIAPGPQSYDLLIHTNGGVKKVAVKSYVASDAGNVALAVTDSTTLSCQSSTFSIQLKNTTCDTIAVESVTLAGTNAGDFSLPAFSRTVVPVGGSITMSGTYAPQAGGTRNATATIHIRRHDGSTLDTIIAIQALAVASPPIPISLPDSSIVESAGNTISIPLYATNNSVVTVDEFDATLLLNTDLLSPIRFDPVQPQLLAGSVTAFDAQTKGTLKITFALPQPAKISRGLLGWIRFGVRLTDTMATEVKLSTATLASKTYSIACLSALTLDSTVQFRLDPLCGDRTITGGIAKQLSLTIGSIVPNPARDEVTITVVGPLNGAGELEISDELGHIMYQEAVVIAKGVHGSSIHLQLTGASGIRYVRLRSMEGMSTRRFIVSR